ncbi:MAG: response regulator [Actinomycetota bacterium]
MNEPKVRVLLVDDQPAVRSEVCLVVEATEGFEVVGEASSGEEAVEMAADLNPDLILMDVNLPGINGLEATKLILTHSKLPIVLVLSTYEAQDYEPKALAQGASGYISKYEFSPETLLARWTAART